MTLSEFAILSTLEKWMHIQSVMDYIHNMEKRYELRTRYANYPSSDSKHEQRVFRVDQYQRWLHVKDLYASHRDELSNTLDNEKFQECKSILERIFTEELDDALRDMMNENKE